MLTNKLTLKAHHKLADRLCKAIDAGKAFQNPVVKRDAHGDEYIYADTAVFVRHLNASLTKLGF